MKSLRGIKTFIVFSAVVFVLSGCSKVVDRAVDSVADAVASAVDSDVWKYMPGSQVAPTVYELIEAGEIEALPEEQEEEEKDEHAKPSHIGSKPVGDEIEMSTFGMMRYSYSKLNEEERELYREIYMVLYNHTEEVTLASKDADQADKVFHLVMNDHPEIFYVTGYSMNKYMQGDTTMYIEFTGTYDKTKEEADEAQHYIDDYVDECLAGMPQSDKDYDKVKYVYEYIIEHTEYDLNAEDNQNILSVFSTGRTVCQGYAKATQYILNEMGIPCLLITGVVKGGESHAWNEAFVDGHWTYIDTTWGDASYRNISTGDTWNEISYEYLCVGEKDFNTTHHDNSLIELPKAVGRKKK